MGFNYRLSNILAGIGIGQMKSLDNYVDKRRQNYQYYKNAFIDLSEIEFISEIKNGRSTFWLTALIIKNKKHNFIEKIINNFIHENIELRPVWKPMHLQPLYKNNFFFHYNDKPVSEFLFEHGLCLPSGSQLINPQLDRIIKLLKKNLF